MGCAHSKDHPKNANLVKLKKKYDADQIKKAKLLNIWVIGGDKKRSLELGRLLSEQGGFLLVTEDSLLQTEMETESERGRIIAEILEDDGAVCPGIVLDLALEAILSNIESTKGLVFHGIPRDREQAWHLQRLVGQATLVVYCEMKAEDLRQAFYTENCQDEAELNARIVNFKKNVQQLLKHKNIITVNNESEPKLIIDECFEKINSIVQ